MGAMPGYLHTNQTKEQGLHIPRTRNKTPAKKSTIAISIHVIGNRFENYWIENVSDIGWTSENRLMSISEQK
jgi:hypothetical protein